jgi:hypothetical protein
MTKESNPIPEVYKFLSTPEAERLGELYLIQGDLNAAYEALELYFRKYSSTRGPRYGQSAVVGPSLFRDGVLLFCACFSKSDGAKLHPEKVYGHLGADAMKYAQKLLDLRDAFVAHNFGPQRQHDIVIVCPTIDGELVPYAFTQYFVRFTGWAPGEKKQMLSFIDAARKHLKGLIQEAEMIVTSQVARITPEELASLPDAEVKIPDPKDYRLSRSKFRKSGRGSRLPVPQRRLGRTIVLSS